MSEKAKGICVLLAFYFVGFVFIAFANAKNEAGKVMDLGDKAPVLIAWTVFYLFPLTIALAMELTKQPDHDSDSLDDVDQLDEE